MSGAGLASKVLWRNNAGAETPVGWSSFISGKHNHGRLGKAQTWKDCKLLSLENGRVSESDSLQLRTAGGTPVGISDAKTTGSRNTFMEGFNLVFTPGRGGKVLEEEPESRGSSQLFFFLEIGDQ